MLNVLSTIADDINNEMSTDNSLKEYHLFYILFLIFPMIQVFAAGSFRVSIP